MSSANDIGKTVGGLVGGGIGSAVGGKIGDAIGKAVGGKKTFEKLFYSLKDSAYNKTNKGWNPHTFRISDGKYRTIAQMQSDVASSNLKDKSGSYYEHIDESGQYGNFEGMVKDENGNLYDNKRNGTDYYVLGHQTKTIWKTAKIELGTQKPLLTAASNTGTPIVANSKSNSPTGDKNSNPEIKGEFEVTNANIAVFGVIGAVLFLIYLKS